MALSLQTAKVLIWILIAALSAFSGLIKKEKRIKILPECEKYKERQAFPCGEESDPICASDNTTYTNYCKFCMLYWRIDSGVKFVHYGFCKTDYLFGLISPNFSNLATIDFVHLT